MNEKLLTITEVARCLGMPEEAVRELVKEGELPAYEIGEDLLRFRREQIEKYRERHDFSAKGDKALINSVEAGKQYVPMAQNKRPGMNYTITPNQENAPYAFWERFADFLYYNDFYILSLIILVLTIVLVFGF
jgi:excisionase family DNA binding protein